MYNERIQNLYSSPAIPNENGKIKGNRLDMVYITNRRDENAYKVGGNTTRKQNHQEGGKII
jgi:hypothetical protein